MKKTYYFVWNLFFILLITSVEMQSCNQKSYEDISYDFYKQMEKWQKQKTSISDADNKLLQELWGIFGDCYKKIIETTALYFTGMLPNTDQFHRQLIFEVGKHMLYASQLIGQYIPKLLANPDISWRSKITRSCYVTSFLVILIAWMKEYYLPQRQIKSLNWSSDMISSNSNMSLISSTELQPRQRPVSF